MFVVPLCIHKIGNICICITIGMKWMGSGFIVVIVLWPKKFLAREYFSQRIVFLGGRQILTKIIAAIWNDARIQKVFTFNMKADSITACLWCRFKECWNVKSLFPPSIDSQRRKAFHLNRLARSKATRTSLFIHIRIHFLDDICVWVCIFYDLNVAFTRSFLLRNPLKLWAKERLIIQAIPFLKWKWING